MAQAAVTNTFIIQMNFRLLYFAMENIKSTKLHDRNYWNRLQSIMYEQIDKNATYNKEFLKHSMTQMMMFYCKEVRDENRDFYDEVCKPIYNIVEENADDNYWLYACNDCYYVGYDSELEYGTSFPRTTDLFAPRFPIPDNLRQRLMKLHLG